MAVRPVMNSSIKKASGFIALVATLTAAIDSAYGQRIKIDEKSKSDLLAIQAYSQNPDLEILYPLDSTNHSIRYRMRRVKQEDLINFFSPFYDHKICEPGNYTHDAYRQYMREGNTLLSKAKATCIKELKDDEERAIKLRGLVKDTTELRKCIFKLIPAYYLTYNVVSYKGESEEEFKSFFNLDTTYYHYLIIKDNSLIYKFRFKNGVYYGHSPLQSVDSLQYSYIKGLGKEPIGISPILATKKFRGTYSDFGFVDQKKLVLTSCRHGMHYIIKDGTMSQHRSFVSECSSITSKLNYIDKDNTLFQVIQNEYVSIVVNEESKPIPGLEVERMIIRSE